MNHHNVSYALRYPQKQSKIGILLFHGLAGTTAELMPLANRLRQQGYIVETPLIHGLGGGTDLESRSNWKMWSDQAYAAYRALQEKVDQVHLGGLCAGCLLALSIVQRNDVSADAKLLLLSPTFKIDGWAIPKSLRWFDLVQDRFFARFFSFSEQEPYGIKDDRIRKIVLAALRKEHAPEEDIFTISGVKMLEFRRMARFVRRRLHKITNPVLVVHSPEDDQSSMKNFYLIVENVKSTCLMAITLRNSFHVITLDKEREEVAKRSIEFLLSGERSVMQRDSARQMS